MKSSLLTTLVFICLLLNLPGRSQGVVPQKSTIEHNDKNRPCLKAVVRPMPKTLKKAWQDYLKDSYDFKIKGIGFLTNKDLLTAEKVTVNEISPKAMDFYTKIVEHEDGSEMSVFASHGYDIYISKEKLPSEFAAMKGIFQEFLQNFLPQYHQELIKDTQKKIKGLEGDRKSMEKQIRKDKRKIEKLNKEIDKINEALISNKSELRQIEQLLRSRKNELKRVQETLDNM